MKKTIIFESIGFGEWADDKITIELNYSPSNDFESVDISDNEGWICHDIAVADAIRKSFDSETADFILRHI